MNSICCPLKLCLPNVKLDTYPCDSIIPSPFPYGTPIEPLRRPKIKSRTVTLQNKKHPLPKDKIQALFLFVLFPVSLSYPMMIMASELAMRTGRL